MNVIYSTGSSVEFDGNHYYNSSIQATYKRYLPLCGNGKVVVICYKKDVKVAKSDKIDSDRIEFVFVNKLNSFKHLFNGSIKKNDDIVKETVKRVDYCVVHVPCDHSYQVIKYAEKYHKPFMSVVVGCPWDAMWNFDWRGKLLAPYAYLKMRSVQKKATHSIYVTDEFLQKRYPTKGLQIGCSNVNITTGEEVVLEKRLKRLADFDKTKIIIGTVAAVNVPYKGQKYVIEAVSALNKKGYNFEYQIVGGGDNSYLKSIVERYGAEDYVHFMGALPHSMVCGYLDNIDVYIQPSKQEGLPRATIEAMSRGCLCAGSRIAGIPELLDAEYLFTKGSVKGITRILKRISVDDLRCQAVRNFNKAKEYDKDILNKKRKDFILEFKNAF